MQFCFAVESKMLSVLIILVSTLLCPDSWDMCECPGAFCVNINLWSYKNIYIWIIYDRKVKWFAS